MLYTQGICGWPTGAGSGDHTSGLELFDTAHVAAEPLAERMLAHPATYATASWLWMLSRLRTLTEWRSPR